MLLCSSYVAYGQSAWGGGGWWWGGSSTTHTTMDITLYPWWNVVSTPFILSSISFSNNWNWINFSKLQNWQWVDVPVNASNIKPLEWYMVYNNNSENVTLSFTRKTDVSPTEATLQKNLNFWWDLLWITTTNSPFNNVPWATMSLDFTYNWSTNLRNKVNTDYYWNSTSSNINNPQLWEAYWIFINQQNAVYWWVNWWWSNGWNEWWNNWGNEWWSSWENNQNVDCTDIAIALACELESDWCPEVCWAENWDVRLLDTYSNNQRVTYWKTGVKIWAWKIAVQWPVSLSFDIKARSTTNWISNMNFIVWDTIYTWVKTIQSPDTVFTFSNVIISEKSNFYVTVDVTDDDSLIWTTFNFSPIIDKNAFTEVKFIDNNQQIEKDRVLWSLTLSSVTIEFPQITETNTWAPDWIEFYLNENARKEVLYMTYKTTKWNAYIDSVYLEGSKFNDNNVTLELIIWWNNIWELEVWEENKITLQPIEVTDSVYVSMYATIDSYEEKVYDDLKLHILAKDVVWHNVREVVTDVHPITVIEKNASVVDDSIKSSLGLKWDTFAFATLNFTTNVEQDSLSELTISFPWSNLSANDIRVWSNYDWYYHQTLGTEYQHVSESNWNIKYAPNLWLSKNSSNDLSVLLPSDTSWVIEMRIKSINNKPQNSFAGKIKYVDAYPYISKQENMWDYTRYTVKTRENDSVTAIKNLELRAWSEKAGYISWEISNGDTLAIAWTDVTRMIDKIKYTIVYEWWNEEDIEVEKSNFDDYFKAWNHAIRDYYHNAEYLRVFRVSD